MALIQLRLLVWEVARARWAIVAGLIIALLIAALTAWRVQTAEQRDVFGSRHSSDTGAVCRRYGDGVVCSPAPDGVKRYRDEQRRVQDAAKS